MTRSLQFILIVASIASSIALGISCNPVFAATALTALILVKIDWIAEERRVEAFQKRERERMRIRWKNAEAADRFRRKLVSEETARIWKDLV